jgi:hypothetical protein
MKICIIGGGTAGWLAALWVVKMQKAQHQVTVVDSSKIGIIGTGEGTTGHFSGIIKNVIGNFGIDEAEFMRETRASHKMGINFVNWKGDQTSFIAPIDNAPIIGDSEQDHLLMYHCLYGNSDRVHMSTVCGQLADSDSSTYNHQGTESYGFCAYHFDGHLVGKYFKKLAGPLCHQVIDSEFKSAQVDQQGYIKSIELTNGETIAADWFIDASGFARVLAATVKPGWHSYRNDLTCDRAIPFQLPHKPGTVIRPLTESRAMNAGWMWNIPTQDRMGCGYVYDSQCISYDQALTELTEHFGHEIKPIKHIEFEPGRLEETFCKNVMFIGLSGVFLEPLQATSIHGTISQLQCFHHMVLRPDTVPRSALQNQRANQLLNRGFDQFADLIQLHYRSGRQDTEFWRKQQSLPLRPANQYLKELSQRRWPHAYDWELNWSSAGYGVFIYPLLNYQWIDLEQIQCLVNPQLDKAYARWWDKITRIRSATMSHTTMLDRVSSGKITKLIYNDQIPPPPKMQSQAPRGIHPLLRL